MPGTQKMLYCLPVAALLLICSSAMRAQPRHALKWEPLPKLHSIPDSLLREPAVFILDERRIQMESAAGADYAQYYTTHRIIRINDDKGAEVFNTFNIPVVPGTKLYELKARTILPGGKVIEVSRDKMKKITSERGLPEYLVAMEGITRGVEVELLYTELMPGSATGTEIFQYRIPVQKAIFRMYVPDNMRYEAKGYNGFPLPKDSFAEDQRVYSAVAYNIPGLEQEKDSRYRALLQRVDYKLSYVERTEHAADRRMSWPEMAKELYRKYGSFGDRGMNVGEQLIRKIGIGDDYDEASRIMAIEDYLKKNFSISNSLSDDRAADFDQTLEKRVTTEKGFVRLFAACLYAADVRYEIGMVGNRFRYEMDETLELWEHLEEYCFYFPRLRTYLVPAAITYRYPFVPYQVCGAKGVFAKLVKGSDGKSKPVTDYRTIPHDTLTNSGIALKASVKFEGAGLVPYVNTSIAFKGHTAADLRGTLLSLPEDKKRDLVLSIAGVSDKTTDMERYAIENAEITRSTSGKPLTLTADIHAPGIMEKAGPRYLFKVGALIGKQSDLYDMEERKLPVETEYPNEQLRTLRISIPQGYSVANPEVLKVRESCVLNGEVVCGFTSDFKKEGADIIVTIREYYTRTSYPLSIYKSYRNVYNAAADFNKVVLVLQKG